MEFNYENLKVSHAKRYWHAGQYDTETDYIDKYNVGFGKVITITNSTAYNNRFSCDCGELIGGDNNKLKSALNRLNDNAKCVGFCLAYQYVMSKIIACKMTNRPLVEYWTEKKDQLINELSEGKFSDPRKYFNSEEEFLQFANAAKFNRYDEKFVDQATAVEKADKKVAMKKNVKSAFKRKIFACISQCALELAKERAKKAGIPLHKERTMF